MSPSPWTETLATSGYADLLRLPDSGSRENDRARIDFDAFAAAHPELAARIVLLRTNVRTMRWRFAADADRAADRAYGRFLTITIGTVIVALFGAFLAWQNDGALTAAHFVTDAAGIIGAGAAAFGVHHRYRALFRGRWALETINARLTTFGDGYGGALSSFVPRKAP
ncbi:MAG: hypothetical protein AAFU49_13395 [Pseudomonadota bacterium]